jgi:SOS-response transcriptional repressor LexA
LKTQSIYAKKLRNRLAAVVEKAGGIRALALRTGIGEDRIGAMLRASSVCRSDMLAILTEHTGYSAQWLLTGEEEPPSEPLTVQCIAAGAAHGPDAWIPDAEGHERKIVTIPKSAHLVQVRGDSLSPTVLDSQWVWVVDEEPQDGGIAVIEKPNGEILIKRVYFKDSTVSCASVNQAPEFRPIDLPRKGLRMRRVVGTWWYK